MMYRWTVLLVLCSFGCRGADAEIASTCTIGAEETGVTGVTTTSETALNETGLTGETGYTTTTGISETGQTTTTATQ